MTGSSASNAAQRAVTERRAHDGRLVDADFDLAPFTIAWELTRACAFACKHCRAEAQPKPDPNELNTEEALQLVDQIREFGDPILVITGGDPMMRRDVFDILHYAVEKGLRTSLTPTTTQLVTRERLDRVKEAGVRRVAVSLDGPTADVHDAFRGFSGSFDIATKIIRNVAEAGLSLQINTTVSRYNVDMLDEMAELVGRSNVVQWSLFFLVPTGRANAVDMISPAQHEDIFNWLCDIGKSASFDIKSTAAPAYRRVVIQRKRAAEGAEGEPRRPQVLAGAGYRYEDGLGRPARGVNDGNGFCFISHTGDVCPSGFLPVSAGNVREQSLVDIYRSAPLFRSLRDSSGIKGKCGSCDFLDVCGGSRARAYAIHGDPLAEDPSCVYQSFDH